MPVCTTDVIDRAVLPDADFKGSDKEKRIYRVHEFLKRRHLTIRKRSRVSQITDAELSLSRERTFKINWIQSSED